MSIREVFPGDRGGEATQDVALLLAGITLPSIESFGSDNVELVGLPARLLYPLPEPEQDLELGLGPVSGEVLDVVVEPRSVLSVAEAVRDAGVAAMAELNRLEGAVAGCKARLAARVAGAAAVEAAVWALDGFQRGVASAGLATEVAFALGIPEPTAASLLEHSVVLIRERPAVLAALEAGELSWRHAVVINEEIATLGSMGSSTFEDEAVLESRLLFLAPGTTAFSFMSKARRVREKMFPETIPVRVKEAFTKRKLSCEVGADGMAWLGLHMPAVSASGIYTRCTRLARAIKADGVRAQREADAAGTGQDCREHRTLAQLRADVAAILLLGQNLPESATQLLNNAEATLRTNNNQSGPETNTRPDTNTRPNTCARSDTCTGTGSPAGPDTNAGTGSSTGQGAGVDQQSGARPEGQDAEPVVPPCAGGNATTADPVNGPALTVGTESAESAAARYFASAVAAGNPGDTDTDTDTDVDGDELVVRVGVVGDGSGLVGDVVDGVVEDPQADYVQQLVELAVHGVLVDPPMPEALVLVKVPFLGLLGITDEPAELVGAQGGPVPEDVARKLLKNSSSFLRVLTDPITGEALPLEPQRYILRGAERAVLQGLAGCCYVPNCPHPVLDTELDHLRAFEFGGPSVMANLRPACKRHHLMKHFKDDKNRHGRRRCLDEPERQNIKLRGWTPKLSDDGRIGWITPGGRYRPPLNTAPERPEYPKWLKNLISKTTQKPTTN